MCTARRLSALPKRAHCVCLGALGVDQDRHGGQRHGVLAQHADYSGGRGPERNAVSRRAPLLGGIRCAVAGPRLAADGRYSSASGAVTIRLAGMSPGSQLRTASRRFAASGWPRKARALRSWSLALVSPIAGAPVCLESFSPTAFTATGT